MHDMKTSSHELDLSQLRARPLAERVSLSRVEDALIDPDAPPPTLPGAQVERIADCANRIRTARERGASVLLIFGAHLVRNGAAAILERMMTRGWITHLATNGAGTIHDWENAWLGRSTESVRDNVATGTFGAWDETGRFLHLALLVGGLRGDGYGAAIGRFIHEDGATLPTAEDLVHQIIQGPTREHTPARADLLAAMRAHGLPAGRIDVEHRWKHASVLAQAFRHVVPVTVHPGIGYDIIACHPMFNGAAIGRAAGVDFARFCAAVDGLDGGGVALSIGSAIMGPQVFEKAMSCANNLRLQEDRPIVAGHSIDVVDLQDGGGWDWATGEPPKSNPAYYLRFCKSYARMGGAMHYHQCDNAAFLHNLYHQLMKL
jgi:hypothetical protein